MTVTVHSAQPQDFDAVARLCWDYRALLVARAVDCPSVVEAAYRRDDYSALIADLPRIHARPRGDILLAWHKDAVIGCAMYYPLEKPGLTEIKRVYVKPEARGLGAGKALMTSCLARAARDGYTRAVVDTIAPLTEAIALYVALGFAPCPPFYDPDPAFMETLRFFDIALEGG